MRDLSFLKGSVIAHRGVHNEIIPENTIEAFKIALENNYIIELDVHLTKDNEVVVFHDDSLKRMLNISGDIKDHNYSNLCKYYLKNSKCYIPKLKDVLELVDGKVPVIIELKYDNKVGILETELVKILDNYHGEFCVQSFSPLSIKWFKKNRPDFVRGLLLGKKNSFTYFMNYFFIFCCKPNFLSCDYSLFSKNKLSKFRKKYLLLCWTVRNQDVYNEVYDIYDNYIMENIDLIKRK